MDLNEYLERLTDEVVNPILEYMAICSGEDEEEEFEDFTRENVDECAALLKDYLTALSELDAPSDNQIMALVEQVVLALNDLNEKTDYAMIETSEREAICILIQDAAVSAGLQEIPDDVTEDWRDF